MSTQRPSIIASLAAALLIGGFVIVPQGDAFAASAAQRECEADGGSYDKSGPDAICVYPEETHCSSEKGNCYGTITQDTTTGHGNLSPGDKPGNENEDDCDGNKGQCKK